MNESEEQDEFVYNPECNYDESTIAQQEQIDRNIAKEQPFISEKLKFSELDDEYKTDAVYLAKVKELKTKYSCFRRTRGDGNCFYRAFGFAYFELLRQDVDECKRFKEIIKQNQQDLIDLGFPQFTLDDFYENFIDVLEKVESQCPIEELLQIFNNQGCSNYLVVYLRLLVSGYLQKKEEFFTHFVEHGQTVKDFCGKEVEPMGRESDHIHITALTSAINVPIRVEYMDRVGTNINSHDFLIEQNPKIFLLYRPGHFDVLYQ
ncbi:ubiquitin thioesterase OTUB1-like [Tubulanus polymorphus]|uniref:ubiquitin thioesterase OTUB1-like n=1 Tax=Tubulanus polymorphus TaxID=672921 RepID=UPI003DA45C9E